MAIPAAFASIGRGLLGAGKGVGTAAQYVTAGGKYKDVGRAMMNPFAKVKEGERNPLSYIGGAGIGAGFLLPMFFGDRQLTDQQLLSEFPELELQRRQARAQQRAAKIQQIRNRERQRDIEKNERKLQQMAPDLYNRISAGRYLPSGAVVIGGVPRRDLIRELAEAMGDGAFTPPTEGQVGVNDLLT